MLLVGVMVALVVVANALAPAPAEAAKRFKVVTKTFSKPQPITISEVGAATPYPSEKTVAGFKRGRILDVNLSLRSFSHNFPPDVDVLLSKGNIGCTVMSDVGGFPDANNITLLLDDEAANRLPVTGQLVGGRFKPTNAEGPDLFFPPVPSRGFPALSGFDGLNPNGTWQLRVVDDDAGIGGEFAGGWSITIKARVPR
jgi:large repetitive protein